MSAFKKIVKENGKLQNYSSEKALNAILSTMEECGCPNEDLAKELVEKVEQELAEIVGDRNPTTNEWADVAVKLMRKQDKKLADTFADNRIKKSINRLKSSNLMKGFRDILESAGDDPNSINTENANLSGFDPAAQLHRMGSEANKNYVLNYLIPTNLAKAHNEKWLHIHDLDYFELNYNCLQVDLKAALKDGFNTGSGMNKEPHGIRSAAALAAIVMQSSTNQQHGGVAIGNLDFGLSKYVNITFRKEFRKAVENFYEIQGKPIPLFLNDFTLDRLYYGITVKDIEDLYGGSTNKLIKQAERATMKSIEKYFDNAETITYRVGEDTFENIPVDLAAKHITMLMS